MQLLKEKRNKLPSVIIRAVLALYCAVVVIVGIAEYSVPCEITVREDDINIASVNADGVSSAVTVEAKLFGAIPIKKVNVNIISDTRLVPCGNVFGVKFFTKGVLVVRLSEIETKNGFVSPAREAGICEGDIIQSINGIEVNTVEEMAYAVENSGGSEMS
ncbi:MAG: hypothetical protein IJ939_01980, partial [Clostridia bacterium]|nr:hypothetical protein [Clostridia bacterium]